MRSFALVAAALFATACGDSAATGPFDGLPLDGTFVVDGLDRPVHVARDRYGVAHIVARTVSDAGFVQGYVMAHDRLPQMDILRRFGAGTLSELFGALDPSVIDTDLEMRMHRMKPLAEVAWAQLQASSDPVDQEIVQLLQRFADGVNTYAAELQAGTRTLDDNLLVSFDPARFVAWSPIDSLVLGRFQAFSLSWTTPFELEISDLYQKLTQTYETNPTAPERIARAGITRDLMTFTPVGLTPTIDGFPNVTTDTGSSSDGGVRPRRRAGTPAPSSARAPGDRPVVPQELMDRARAFFASDIHTGAFGSLGPHAFMRPHAGSNNWAVGPSLTGGSAILASDQHLQLPNPSIFYPTHLTVQAEGAVTPKLDVMGVTFPGIPGVILGSNGSLAWSATVSEHDVNDIYLEQIAPCGAGSCVTFNGQQVPIETVTEELKIGALGTITETRTVTYERVPHHGPIIPTVENGRVVPRTGTTALSVKYTGYEPTFEIRALWNLAQATSVQGGFAALADFSYGSQNWTMIDSDTTIGWTTEALVPEREAATYQWHPVDRPTAQAPFFVMDGRGGHEWVGRMSPRYVPHAIDPAQGYLATANADPVGATFDNDPLNQPVVGTHPLYVGVSYAAGVRQERIATMIETGAKPITPEDMARFQHDSYSTVGAKLTPRLLAALGRLESSAGAPPDVAPYVSTLTPQDRQRLDTARALLASWTFATPTAVTAPDPNSAATALFNAWMHYFLERGLADEFATAGFNVWHLNDNQLLRIVHAILATPGTMTPSASSGEPILCDRIATPGPDESCTKLVLETLLAAMTHLESPAAFGTANTAQWRWGALHRLTIDPLFPNPALSLPAPGESAVGGFAKPGDNFVVNRADQGWDDLDFSQSADGPAQRFLAIANGSGSPIQVRWQIPGGVIFDPRSPHYRDLLDNYYLPEVHFDAPFAVEDIVRNGETRWEFR